jgi:hypothetical protein
MGGSNNQTITQNALTIPGPFRVNKTGGTASLSTNLTTSSTCAVAEGVFDLNSRVFKCGSTFTVEDGGVLEMFGSEAYTLPTYSAGSTIKYTGDGDAGADTYGASRAVTGHHVTVATTDSGDSVTAANTAGTNLEGYWTMDDASWTNDCSTGTVNDSSSNNNDGKSCPASTGPTGGAAGNFGNAGSFDGTDDYVEIPSNAAYNGAGTWSIWMKSDGSWNTDRSDTSNRANIMSRSDSDSCSGLHILPAPSGQITIAAYRSGCGGATVLTLTGSTTVVTNNNWHMITVVFSQASGGTISLYVDGVLDASGTTSNSWSFNSQVVRLGISEGFWWEFYEGSLDDARIYSRQMSAQEVYNMYIDGTNITTSTLDVNGNFTHSSGTFTAPTSTMSVGGNFARSGGTFTHNSGTVTLDDATQTANVSGSTTFNNLSSTTAGKNIIVESGSTQTVSTFTLTGSAGNRIKLKGSSGNSQWDLVATTPSVSYVEARDSDACGGTSVSAVNSINLGNNSCWSFSQSNPNEVKVQRGVNIQRGTTIQRN